MGEFANFVKMVISALTESKIGYVIVGGVIAIHYGRPRLTQDIDVIISVDPKDITSVNYLANCLKKFGFEAEATIIHNALTSRSHATIFHRDYPILHIDIKGIYDELDEMVFKGRVKGHIYCCEGWIEKPEDLIIAKLKYGSQQDIEDASAILRSQRDKINFKELNLKAEKFKVKRLLLELIEELNLI